MSLAYRGRQSEVCQVTGVPSPGTPSCTCPSKSAGPHADVQHCQEGPPAREGPAVPGLDSDYVFVLGQSMRLVSTSSRLVSLTHPDSQPRVVPWFSP